MREDLTVIIPIDKLDENTTPLFEAALKSVTVQKPDMKVIAVGPSAELEKIKPEHSSLIFVENEDINLPKQVNTAVAHVKTKYFTVLEYDDVFTEHWFDNLDKWAASNPDLFAYLPINEVFDYKDNKKVFGYLNEPVWASSFSEKLGYFDTDSLMNYININCTGGVFNTEDFIEIGGLKESIKLTFWYEFILRADHKAKKIYVIPKIGLRHGVNRDGSLMDIYSKTISSKEADWWINLAREEHFFKKDRKKTYEE